MSAVIAMTALGMHTPCCSQEANPALTRRKAEIVTGITQAEEYLSHNRLQDARSKVELLNHKFGLLKADLSVEDAASFKTKIDNISGRVAAKEDSLVKVPVMILYSKGPDAALAYLQNNLKTYGVSEKKTEAIEKKILEEGPKVRQEIERKALERTIKALNNGQTTEPGLDPYILAAAKRAIKAHADSILAAKNEKMRKEDLEKQRQERIRQEKLDKEKKLNEEKAANLRQEQEKKRLAEIEIARKKTEAAEKAHKDSLAAVKRDSVANALKLQQQIAMREKERQRKQDEQQHELARSAKAKEDSVKHALALKEKAHSDSMAALRSDSIAAVQKVQLERAEKEKARVRVLREEQKKQERAEQAEENRKKREQQARNDSLAALQETQQQQEKARQGKQAVLDKAQALTLELYDMLDKKKTKKALEKFEQDQGFLVSTMEPDAYHALDHAIVFMTIMDLTEPLPESRKNQKTAMSSQRQSLDKIYGFAKDDKIEAAYTQFKLTEKSLASFMAKDNFNLLKALVEGAYRLTKKSTGNAD
jgi:hypothetical protein